MEISELRDKLIENIKLLKDRIYKWKLMKKFGDYCPRCSRRLILFSMDKECYKKFITLNLRQKRDRMLKGKPEKNKCALCSKPVIGLVRQRYFCEFCGNVK